MSRNLDKARGCSDCNAIIQGPCKLHDCLWFLGITPDQLLIARALDREKVWLIRDLLAHTIFDTKQAMLSAQGILSFLPNFPEERPYVNEKATLPKGFAEFANKLAKKISKERPCEHEWTGKQSGGCPDDAASTEWVKFCKKCGDEYYGE